jgi:hypothetical protein
MAAAVHLVDSPELILQTEWASRMGAGSLAAQVK